MSVLTVPNILSVSRIGLAIVMCWAVLGAYWMLAVTILWIAIATDLADGYVARRTNDVTALGGLLDHGSDALFVTLTIAAWTVHGYAPLALAVLIPIAFTQYMLDSASLAGQPLKSSFIGRYNGIAYFVFAGFPVMQLTLGITLVPFDWFIWAGWVLVLTTLISMIDRLVTLIGSRNE